MLLSNTKLRPLIMTIMIAAFLFGFMDMFFPVNFERLHIFLFNVTTGGFIILYFSMGKKEVSPVIITYFLFSIAYTLLAFYELYLYAIPVSLILFGITESIRIKVFSFFPFDFFRPGVSVEKKFHHASLLCLSLALLISTAVILNHEYYHWICYEKLTLDVFFLGFSFPVSLVTMSVMFHFIEVKRTRFSLIIDNSIFWTVNLGVIVFFVFIILELFIPEVIVACMLFTAVLVLFIYFLKYGRSLQQKGFLVSGMTFLLFTAITGILYIPAHKLYSNFETIPKLILQAHASISLYGWNLSGLFVLLRWHDFPLRLNSRLFILFHWIIIVFLVPLGEQHAFFSITASLAYTVLLLIFFNNHVRGKD